jgi:integrase
MRYCKTENGWGRYTAAIGRNGRVRPDYVIIKGAQRGPYPSGHYELRLYKGSKVHYKNVGKDPTEALSARYREMHLLVARDSAKSAGVQIVEEKDARVHLRKRAIQFLTRQQDRGHERAAETAKQAIDDFLQITGHVYSDEIKEDSILLFYRTLRLRGNADRTIYNKHVSLFGFLRWLDIDTKKLADRPPSFTERAVVVYHPADLRTLFTACDPYQRLIFEVLLKTGLRMQEAMHLTWPDIDFREKKLRVLERTTIQKRIKDRGERIVPCPTDLIERLQDWRLARPNFRYVLGTANDTPNWKIREMLKRLARKVGLNCGDCDGCSGNGNECRLWNVKKFRATYTTMLIRDGIDLRTVMEYTGHKDLATVMKYLAAANNLPERIDSIEFLGVTSPGGGTTDFIAKFAAHGARSAAKSATPE